MFLSHTSMGCNSGTAIRKPTAGKSKRNTFLYGENLKNKLQLLFSIETVYSLLFVLSQNRKIVISMVHDKSRTKNRTEKCSERVSWTSNDRTERTQMAHSVAASNAKNGGQQMKNEIVDVLKLFCISHFFFFTKHTKTFRFVSFVLFFLYFSYH